MAAFLDATSYITLDGNFDWSNEWSIEMEVWVNETPATTYCRFIYYDGTNRIQYRHPDSEFWFEMDDDRRDIAVDPIGHWRTYRFTYSGGLTGIRNTYFDGVLVDTDTVSATSLPNAPITIGAGSESLQGWVRNVAISNGGSDFYTASLESSEVADSGSSTATNNGATFGSGPTHTPATIYVDSSAAITDESGSYSNPCLTIADAVALARKYDTVFVRRGVYREVIELAGKTDITIVGDRGPNNEWWSVIDGTVAVPWEPATEKHESCWKAEVDFYAGTTRGKYLFNGDKLVPKVRAGYSEMDILASDWDFETTDRPPGYGTGSVKLWDVVYAIGQGIDVEGTPTTYYRARATVPEGDRTQTIDDVTNVRITDKEYGIRLSGRACFNNTVSGLKMFGFHEGPVLIVNHASNNTVENCRLIPSEYAVQIENSAFGNTAQNNDMSQNALQWVGGAWGSGTTYLESKNEFLYLFWKYISHVSDSTQTTVSFRYPGNDNIVRANKIHGCLTACSSLADESTVGYRGLRNQFSSNDVKHGSSTGVTVTKSSHIYLTANVIYDTNSQIRFSSINDEQDTDIWITRNTLKARLADQSQLFFHMDDVTGTHANPWNVSVSSNTMTGGCKFRPNDLVDQNAGTLDGFDVDSNILDTGDVFDHPESDWDIHPFGAFTNNICRTDQDLAAWTSKGWWGAGNSVSATAGA